MRTPARPFVYEINTAVWLSDLSAREGRAVDLGTVPARSWDRIADAGYDIVWLMGVWQRSPAGRAIALGDPRIRADLDASLPGWQPDDVIGSPYCVRDYRVDDLLGGPEGLATARAQLAARGVGLLLDFVPNHVAPDHPWTASAPERFVRGTRDDLAAQPAAFVAVGDHVLACGRDQNYAPWPDVVQLNAFDPGLRSAVVETLRSIAGQCDGVRCDMAMLMLNDVFSRTWADRVGPAPADEYWSSVIGAVRAAYPDFVFAAEAYWDLEWVLQQQGFDFCYDKRLYDRLLNGDVVGVDAHLHAEPDYQEHLLRFVENHDEPRAAAVLADGRRDAVAVATLTQTGARLVHEGQDEGRRVHVPVFLRRRVDEPVDVGVAGFYTTLLCALRDRTFHEGEWARCERTGWPGNDGFERIVAWSWDGERRWLVAVNLSDATAAAHVRVPWDDVRGRWWSLDDPTTGVSFRRSGDDLRDGLYVELGPWRWHLLRLAETSDVDA